MRLQLPPLESLKELPHRRVTLEHRHLIVSTPVDPAAVAGHVRALASSLVATGHRHFPREPTAIVSHARGRLPAFAPTTGIMILVPILLIHLWDEATSLRLFAPIVQH